MPASRYCDGVARRDVLRAGSLGALGLSLGGYLRRLDAGEVQPGKAQSAIFIWLGGGPSHLDSFDMKPEAEADVRGDFQPIDTSVPGLRISEHLPQLASCAEKYALLRGLSHNIAGHELGTSYLNTGNRPVPSLEYPGLGAVISKEKPGSAELPHFVAIPSTPQKSGYLGVRFAPLRTASSPRLGQPFSVRGISLENGLTVESFEQRQRLLDKVDSAFNDLEGKNSLIDGLDRFDQQAYAVISSPRAREAFDVSRENREVAEQFGDSSFGQSCLLALRLVEAGVRFATVSFSGWDTHSNNFGNLRDKLLPQFDRGLAALLAQLESRGLLESTAVLVVGEFGRTPKINPKAGRDHWPRAGCALMAGGGVRGGQVIGASDSTGSGPAGDPISPDQLAASYYRALGIDHRQEYHTSSGRPVMIVREGSQIPGLFG